MAFDQKGWRSDPLADKENAWREAMREARRILPEPTMSPREATAAAERIVQQRFEPAMVAEMERMAQRASLSGWQKIGDVMPDDKRLVLETRVLHKIAIDLEGERSRLSYGLKAGVRARA